MKYKCYECDRAGLYKELSENHFTSEDGKILCSECSEGVNPCSKDILKKIKEIGGVKYNG